MSIIKSFSVGNGDMFYIKHDSDNFTIIDCNLHEEDRERIVNELKREMSGKGIRRFISTSPDFDHIKGLKHICDNIGIENFYVVKNNAAKNEENEDFVKYRELIEDSNKAFHIKAGVQRKWMNLGDNERGSSGIHILWPKEDHLHFSDALKLAEKGQSPNNISPIFRYSLNKSGSVIWMGDLETDFMNLIVDDIVLPETDILIAPHHGRYSGKVPKKFLEQIKPKVIIIGEALSDDLHYYQGYNTITQNRAKDISMNLLPGEVLFFSSNNTHEADFLIDNGESNSFGNYLGTLNL